MAEIDDIIKIIGESIEHYRPGGEFAETRSKELSEKKRIALPQMQSQLVGRGLTGTTVAAAIPSRFEMEVAKPFETETQMLRSSRLMESLLAKAGFMERELGRDLQKELARIEAELREKLQNKQITSQEYQSELDRAQQMAIARMQQKSGGGGGGGGGGSGSGWASDWSTPGEGGAGQHQGSYPAPDFGGGGEGMGESSGVWSGGEQIVPGSTTGVPVGGAGGGAGGSGEKYTYSRQTAAQYGVPYYGN